MQFRSPIVLWFLWLLCPAWEGAGSAVPDIASPWKVIPRAQLVDLPNSLPPDPLLIESIQESSEALASWRPPADEASWSERRKSVESSFRRILGLDPWPARTPLHARIVSTHAFPTHDVENVVLETRPDFWLTANVYRPQGARGQRHPAVVCPIGHFLTPGKTAPEVQARCVKLAQLGFVVLVYDAIGQGERMFPGNIHHDAGYALLPLGQTIAGWMVWDTMRAVDYLESREDVDATRIGITGNSGGGLNTLCSAALDDRLKAAVVVGFTFEFGNWARYGGAHCTCTHWPGAFSHMNWFELGGLIAPRALMMIQGERDTIFPVSGARQTAADVARIFAVMGKSENVKFVELPGMPHAYSKPFREPMYGWMMHHLQSQNDGSSVDEGEVQTLPAGDPRLLCDPTRAWMPKTLTVVEWARRTALGYLRKNVQPPSPERRNVLQSWLENETKPPRDKPDGLSPRTHGMTEVAGGRLERVSFHAQDGVRLPGLLWIPTRFASRPKTIVIADAAGKARVAESGLVPPLLNAGHTVLAVDLRGRGETLGAYGPQYDVNFRSVANQVLLGRSMAGRRAYDLRRTLDYLATRAELASNEVVMVGVGDDALPAIWAAIRDPRMGRLILAEAAHSTIIEIQARSMAYDGTMGDAWNDPQLKGRLKTAQGEVDFGSVVPSSLQHGDIPEFLDLVTARKCKVLFCQARDAHLADHEFLKERFRKVFLEAAGDRVRYAPETTWGAALLLEWMD